MAGYRRLKVAGGPTWFLGAYAPESDFMGVLARNEQAAFAIAVVALCIGLLLTMILARRISVPLTAACGGNGGSGRFSTERSAAGEDHL